MRQFDARQFSAMAGDPGSQAPWGWFDRREGRRAAPGLLASTPARNTGFNAETRRRLVVSRRGGLAEEPEASISLPRSLIARKLSTLRSRRGSIGEEVRRPYARAHRRTEKIGSGNLERRESAYWLWAAARARRWPPASSPWPAAATAAAPSASPPSSSRPAPGPASGRRWRCELRDQSSVVSRRLYGIGHRVASRLSAGS